MLGPLLLATFAGVGVASPAGDIVGRSNSPLSFFCKSTNQKCADAKQLSSVSAYCASYLNLPIPKTATKTRTAYSTTTATTTVFTKTVSNAASTVTSTITSCAAPAAPTVVKRSDDDEDRLEERQARYPAKKPGCMAPYAKAKDIISACLCQAVPQTTTITTTQPATVTSTVSTDTTVNATPTTVYAVPTFAIADDSGMFLDRQKCADKETCSGFYEVNMDYATLYALNDINGISPLYDGVVSPENLLAQSPNESTRQGMFPYRVQQVNVPDIPERQAIKDGEVLPLTCSISAPASDGTCPLKCKVRGDDDVNQVGQYGTKSNWSLGPPGVVSQQTFKTYVVTPVEKTIEPPSGGDSAAPAPEG